MPKTVLRTFQYLNETTVDQYLSQLEGGVIDGPYSSRDVVSQGKEAGGGVAAYVVNVKGGLSTSSSSETERTIRVTPEAKFSRLYTLLMGSTPDEQQIQVLNGFDEEIYRSIQPGEIIEIRGAGRLPTWERVLKAVSDASAFVEVMKLAGLYPFSDPAQQIAYEGMTLLASKKGSEDTLLIVNPLNAPKFSVIARLEAGMILRRKEDLEANVTILGKVQRVLRPGEKIDAFRLMPELSQLTKLAPANRHAGRNGQKFTPKAAQAASPWDEVIKYPAIEVQPIAVYQ